VTPSSTDDGPGAEIPAPAAPQRLQPIIVANEAWCPNPDCEESLIDGGSVTFPHNSFADLSIEKGRIHVVDIFPGDPDPKSMECAACGQPLDIRGWQF
jgi:hypothetical protein